MKGVKKAQVEIGEHLDDQNKRVDKIIDKNKKISDKMAESRKMLAKKL